LVSETRFDPTSQGMASINFPDGVSLQSFKVRLRSIAGIVFRLDLRRISHASSSIETIYTLDGTTGASQDLTDSITIAGREIVDNSTWSYFVYATSFLAEQDYTDFIVLELLIVKFIFDL